MDIFKRIEMRIAIERNPRKRAEMRKVLENLTTKMEESK